MSTTKHTPWIKSSEQMPEYNVGVLVFIPEEDNHITAGMWDVSQKWVLLDEYRIPRSEVTYWMPIPQEPEDKSYDPFTSDPDEFDLATEKISKLQKDNYNLNAVKIDLLQCLKNCLSVKPHKVSVEAMKDLIKEAIKKAKQ